MHRCLQLAKLGEGHVAPNPMVGAVLVHDGHIIGEGYHKQYGGPHAEVECITSVKPEHQSYIPASTLYVSLEPCAHFGKTPPCADLIIKNEIKEVVIGCRDPFDLVNGKGIEKLEQAGCKVIVDVLKQDCLNLNKRFFTFYTQHRPFIVLKWAQTADGKIANQDLSRVLISNELSNRIVHKMRSQQMAILVGTNTALFDNPELTTRLWPGQDPIRMVVDMDLRLPASLQLFNGSLPTIVFNKHQHTIEDLKKIGKDNVGVQYYQVTDDVSLVYQISNALHLMNIQSLLIEGGAQLLQSFIDEGMWDEAHLIVNEALVIGNGLPAPILRSFDLVNSERLHSDTIRTYKNSTL
ncbi:MAG: bifunctional diaminohydroxyphosphoribosylaminopyrimidine deaminase/5-amino-6-(5-phosphoribosylamino)uracil reductase RibD [Pedobacter sp.]|nr:MAG: bifunctional diaminohydroxyphosphoribosylaminopyrimidine deaminase/5-amino-6-(5-phosphoribosylamino)uracil reductase RibD [Pedobacter sp.]